MGVLAKYPIALAPGMGENFFFVSVITALAAFRFDFSAAFNLRWLLFARNQKSFKII